MYVKTGRIVRNAADKHFADKNGEVRYGYTVAVNYADGHAEFLEASTTSEKLAKCLTKGKLIAVAYESTTVKQQTVNGKVYRHEYMNGAKISFVPEYKREAATTGVVEDKAAEVVKKSVAIKSLKEEIREHREYGDELGYDDDMPF